MQGKNPIIIWLLSGCLLILIMVIIGGITRLTDSGLSMVNWSIYGEFPNEENILESYKDWKESPQGEELNKTFEEFKKIYFWEYMHRMIGRYLLGLVFIIPFIYFLIKKKLNKKLIYQSLVLGVMGAIQGAFGWWMVKSGLDKNPEVSHFWLAIHLITAFLICAYTIWAALPLIFPNQKKGNKSVLRNLKFLFGLVILQIIYGAFVAGLDAGIGFNSWPKMNGEWIPESVYSSLDPLWKNFTEGKWGVQFVHRTLAVLIVFYVFYIWNQGRKTKQNHLQRKSLNILLSLVLLQTALGVLTLVLVVPISLALIHQVGAFLLLMSVTFSLFTFSKSYINQ